MPRYIFITGGVVSSLGKGIAAASLGALLQARGFKVKIRKLDGYLNVDPGTMNPYEHGEVFVTEDGGEADLDLGHYERFTGQNHTKNDVVTMGKIYSQVIAKERRGDYLGGTVMVVPHVIHEVKDFITANTENLDFVIGEVGGTVGDIESLPYLEAIRQLAFERGRDQCCFIHVTLVPFIQASGELKTKATQHSVRTLLSQGIQPDMLLCRTDQDLPVSLKEKIGFFCNVPSKRVMTAKDVKSIYEAPLTYHKEGLDQEVCSYLHLENSLPNLSQWQDFVKTLQNPQAFVKVAIVGKYTKLKDTYKSIHEALVIAGVHQKIGVTPLYIDAEDCEDSKKLDALFEGCHGILVPGGFGSRGIEGKINAIRFAREQKVPFLGICFGMQLAVIEAARNLAHIKDASSTELGKTPHPVVGLMEEFFPESGDLGGTMRLGNYPCQLKEDSLAAKLYGTLEILERHRHRYEVNVAYQEALEKVGLFFSGMSKDGMLPEIVERSDHPFFIASQFHPEFNAKPFSPSPLFSGFLKASLHHQQDLQKKE